MIGNNRRRWEGNAGGAEGGKWRGGVGVPEEYRRRGVGGVAASQPVERHCQKRSAKHVEAWHFLAGQARVPPLPVLTYLYSDQGMCKVVPGSSENPQPVRRAGEFLPRLAVAMVCSAAIAPELSSGWQSSLSVLHLHFPARTGCLPRTSRRGQPAHSLVELAILLWIQLASINMNSGDNVGSVAWIHMSRPVTSLHVFLSVLPYKQEV